MITEKFDHLEDVGDDEARLRCKWCGAEFQASFNMLFPKHVEYHVSENTRMTVTCPECGAKVTADRKRYALAAAIAEMEAKRDFLVAELRKMLKGIDIKFMIKGDRHGPGFGIFDCVKCGTEFEARTKTHPDGSLNIRRDADIFALVCPGCGVEDEINNDNLIQRGRIAALNITIRGINDKIQELACEYQECETE
jgi:transcription elongation factor Elf1